jgi:hypothetical protein
MNMFVELLLRFPTAARPFGPDSAFAAITADRRYRHVTFFDLSFITAMGFLLQVGGSSISRSPLICRRPI